MGCFFRRAQVSASEAGVRRIRDIILNAVFSMIGEFFKDLESDLQKRSSPRSAKPKSLWEELADMEVLEKELQGSDGEGGRDKTSSTAASARARSASQDKREQSSQSIPTSVGTKAPADQAPNPETDDIEDMLAQLKKEMGR